MSEQYLAWLKTTGRVAAGILLMVVAGIATYGTKQWAGLIFVVIGAVGVGMGVRAIRQRKRGLTTQSRNSPPAKSRNSQPADSQPGP